MNPDEPRIQVGAMRITFKVVADDSDGSVSVFECEVPAGTRVPLPHSHDGFEETIYGLEGTSIWTVDGEEREIGPGDCTCIRRGAVHGFENRTDRDFKVLVVASPGIFGPQYFEDIASVLAASEGGPPDAAAMAAVMQKHGLTPAR